MSSLTASEPVPAGVDPNGTAPAILIEDVSVCYRVPRERLTSFKEYAIRALQRRWKVGQQRRPQGSVH